MIMTMEGLEALSQVALADPSSIAQLCFDATNLGGGRLPSESFMDDSLNTPGTANSDRTFFGGVDPLEPVPITATGKFTFMNGTVIDQLFGDDCVVHSLILYTTLEFV